MKIKPIDPKSLEVLRRIQESIPPEWTDNVTHQEDIAPTTLLIIEKALVDPDVSEEVKNKFRLVRDSGFLDKKIDVENSEVSEKINNYVEDEIAKAVIRGDLPKGKSKDLKERIKRLTLKKNGL